MQIHSFTYKHIPILTHTDTPNTNIQTHIHNRHIQTHTHTHPINLQLYKYTETHAYTHTHMYIQNMPIITQIYTIHTNKHTQTPYIRGSSNKV